MLRDVSSFAPLLPAKGDLLTPIVIDIVGTSTSIGSSGRGSAGSTRVSPMLNSGMPAKTTMSPALASSAGVRPIASYTKSSDTLTCLTGSPGPAERPIGLPLTMVPDLMRPTPRRPMNESEPTLEICSCSGSSTDASGFGRSRILSRSVVIDPRGRRARARHAVDRRRVDDLEVGLLVGGAELAEEVERLVDDVVGPRRRLVDLVHDDEHLVAHGEGLLEHEARLRLGALLRVDDEQHAVDHAEDALDLAAKVRVAGGVDDVHLRPLVRDRGVLREDGDAALLLLVVAVHEPIVLANVLAELLGEEGVDERGLAVVDVRDDRDVAQVIAHRRRRLRDLHEDVAAEARRRDDGRGGGGRRRRRGHARRHRREAVGAGRGGETEGERSREHRVLRRRRGGRCDHELFSVSLRRPERKIERLHEKHARRRKKGSQSA